MLGFCTIVTEGSKEFELNGPLPRNNQIALLATIRVPLRRCVTIVRRSRAFPKVLERSVYGVCFCKRADAKSVGSHSGSTLRVRVVYGLESICEVADDVA